MLRQGRQKKYSLKTQFKMNPIETGEADRTTYTQYYIVDSFNTLIA